jgi:hypothetical protein
MKKDSIDPNLGSDICGLVGRICMAEREDLLQAREDLISLIGTGYYEGEGDNLLNEALAFICSKINFIEWIRPPGETCRVVTKSGKTYGLFYDSKSNLRHIAEYEPYKRTPSVTLCNNSYVNFSGTGDTDHICPDCETRLLRILNENL